MKIKISFKIATITALFIIIGACRTDQKTYLEVETIYPLERTVIIDDIKPYIDEIELIPIERHENTIMSIPSKMVLDRDMNIYILDIKGNLTALRPDGKFHRTVALKGRGPREYLHIDDIAISNDGDFLMVLQSPVIKYYGITDTTSFREIIINNIEIPLDNVAPARNLGAYVFGAFAAHHNEYKEPTPQLFSVDDSGYVTGEYLPREDFTISMGNITQVSHNNYILKPQTGSHIVYKLAAEEPVPYFRIDFGKKKITRSYTKKVDITDVETYIKSPYFKQPMFFQETDKHLYFKAAGPEAVGYNFLYRTQGQEGIHWVDREERFPITFMASDPEFFYSIVSAGSIQPRQTSLCPLAKTISELLNCQKQDEDQDYIVKVKFNL